MDIKRKNNLQIYARDYELKIFKEEADKIGLPVSSFCRYMIHLGIQLHRRKEDLYKDILEGSKKIKK